MFLTAQNFKPQINALRFIGPHRHLARLANDNVTLDEPAEITVIGLSGQTSQAEGALYDLGDVKISTAMEMLIFSMARMRLWMHTSHMTAHTTIVENSRRNNIDLIARNRDALRQDLMVGDFRTLGDEPVRRLEHLMEIATETGAPFYRRFKMVWAAKAVLYLQQSAGLQDFGYRDNGYSLNALGMTFVTHIDLENSGWTKKLRAVEEQW